MVRDDIVIPSREGTPPETTNTNPHQQLEENPSSELYAAIIDRIFSFAEDAHREPSKISVPGAKALILDDDVEKGPDEAFMIDREFAHLHPDYDGSMHMALPRPFAERAKQSGWAEPHPVAMRGMIPKTVVMVYAPRDDEEIETVAKFVDISYRFAHGGLSVPALADS